VAPCSANETPPCSGDRVSVVQPLACYSATLGAWARGDTCLQQRDARLSATSGNGKDHTPALTGCYFPFREPALALSQAEQADVPDLAVSPFDARALELYERLSKAAPVRANVLRAASADARRFGDRVRFGVASLVQRVELELDGDGTLDELLVLTAETTDGNQYGALLALRSTQPKAPAIVTSMKSSTVSIWILASSDLDGDGKREFVADISHESWYTTVYRFDDAEPAILGSVSCGP
jgi:hypothetical protein